MAPVHPMPASPSLTRCQLHIGSSQMLDRPVVGVMEGTAPEVAGNTSLDFLQAVYRGADQPMHRRCARLLRKRSSEAHLIGA
jgi:hypothetical protein